MVKTLEFNLKNRGSNPRFGQKYKESWVNFLI